MPTSSSQNFTTTKKKRTRKQEPGKNHRRLEINGILFFQLIMLLFAATKVNRGVSAFCRRYSAHGVARSHFHFGGVIFNSPHQNLRLANNGDNDETEKVSKVEPTWTYTPYQPPKRRNNVNSTNRPFQQRQFSDWTVPKSIRIPEDQLEISFSRSSGSGGQNVNKLNTKVELRFHLQSATWIPKEVRDRIQSQQANRINKEGFMNLSSQEYRTQGQNRKDCLSKLEAIILQAYPRPKVRKQRKGPSKKQKEKRLQEKKKRSEKKAGRGKVDW